MQSMILKYMNISLIDINNMLSPEFDFYYEKIIYENKLKEKQNNENYEFGSNTKLF